MRDKPRNRLEALLLKYLPEYLRAYNDGWIVEGINLRLGSLSVAVEEGPEQKKGIWQDWKVEGAGGKPLELLDYLEHDTAVALAWLEAREGTAIPPRKVDKVGAARKVDEDRAAHFEAVVKTYREDDGRVARYLESRGIPGDLASELGLVDYIFPSGEGGIPCLCAPATDSEGNTLAVQLLQLNKDGRPRVANGKKWRRNVIGEEGWAAQAAFRLPGEGDEVALVEGVEDALSLRAAGWDGPVAATLGKGSMGRYNPPEARVLLVPDGDVPEDQIEDLVRKHVAAGRRVRVARLPDGRDPNDLLQRDGGELLSLLSEAREEKDLDGIVERELRRFLGREGVDGKVDQTMRQLKEDRKIGLRVSARVWKRMCSEHAQQTTGDEAVVVEEEPLAWPEPVDGLAVFEEAMEAFSARMEAPEHVLAVLVLWAAHTHCLPYWGTTPRLRIWAPSVGDGKTVALECTTALCHRPSLTGGATLSPLFRTVADSPEGITIGFDEIENFFVSGRNEELRALFNLNRQNGAVLLRTEEIRDGKAVRREAKQFPTYFALALAGIDTLPPSLRSRCIQVTMLRALPGWKPRRKSAGPGALDDIRELARKVRRFIEDNLSLAEDQAWELPEGLPHRAADNWVPLSAIAHTVGGRWPALLTEAIENNRSLIAERTAAERLLIDIRLVFDARRQDKRLAGKDVSDVISTADLVHALDEYEAGSELLAGTASHKTARQQRVSKRLADFGIRCRRFPARGYPKVDGQGRISGYKRSDFEKLWERYDINGDDDDILPPESPENLCTPYREKKEERRRAKNSNSTDDAKVRGEDGKGGDGSVSKSSCLVSEPSSSSFFPLYGVQRFSRAERGSRPRKRLFSQHKERENPQKETGKREERGRRKRLAFHHSEPPPPKGNGAADPREREELEKFVAALREDRVAFETDSIPWNPSQPVRERIARAAALGIDTEGLL